MNLILSHAWNGARLRMEEVARGVGGAEEGEREGERGREEGGEGAGSM